MNKTEPITHLFLTDSADGNYEYHVVLPVRIAEEIGLQSEGWYYKGIDTFRQLLDAIETRGESAEFEMASDAMTEIHFAAGHGFKIVATGRYGDPLEHLHASHTAAPGRKHPKTDLGE
jgi:hypothetical protein